MNKEVEELNDDEIEDKVNKEEDIIDNARCDISWVKTWDVNTIPENFFMLISSKRRSGKTYLLRYILKHIYKRFDKCYLMSETSHLQPDDPFYFVPKSNRIDHFDTGLIEDILRNQQVIIETNKKLDKKAQVKNKVLILLDDVINDPMIRKSSALKALATQGRHSTVSVILCSQTISSRSGFPAVIRTNCDIFICFILHDQFNRETCSEQYASVVSKKEGMKLINSITTSEPYMAAVFDLSKNNIKNYKDYVYKIKAPDNFYPKFKIGNEESTMIQR
jgi:hypothetical protein